MNKRYKYDIISIREYFPSLMNPSASTWVYNQALGIQEFGMSPIVISPTPLVPSVIKKLKKGKYAWKTKPSKNIENYLGVDVVRPPFVKLPDKYFFNFNFRSLENCIFSSGNRFNSGVIHAHFGNAGVAALKLKNQNIIPLITSFYGFDLGSDKEKLIPYYKILAKEGDLFLALSNDMKRDLLDIGFPGERIVIHHLGVDTDFFTPSIRASESEKFVFAIVAGFSERKGIHFAIQAFNEFVKLEKVSNCELRIVGDGDYKPVLVKLAQNNKDIIFINNYIAKNPRELVKNEMQSCDVFILTSTVLSNADKEGTPIVLMEAQACGKPCISSYHAGIPEVVLHNQTGILVKEGDISGIVAAMSKLYFNPEKRMLLGKNARIHIEENYSRKTELSNLFQIYKSYLS